MSDTSLSYRRSPAAEKSLSDLARDAEWRFVLAGLAAALALLLLAYGATFANMAGVWLRSESFQHAFLVLPTLAYVLWDRRGRIGAQSPRGSMIGLPLAALCGLTWLGAALAGAAEGQHIAAVGALFAVILACLGRNAFRTALLPLLLLAFLVPTGQQLVPALKSLTVWFAAAGARLAGLQTEIGGHYLTVAGQPYLVIDDCAAFGGLLASTFLGLTMGLLLFRRTWKTLLFAAFGGILSILINGLRVNAIVLYGHFQSETMSMSDHLSVGWVMTAFSLLGLLYLANRWRDPKDDVDADATRDSGPARPLRAVALGLASSALFIAMPYVWPLADATAVPRPTLPERLGNWQASEASGDWRPQVTAASSILESGFASGEVAADIFIATAAGPEAEVSGANFRLLNDRKTWWIPKSGPAKLCDAAGCLPIERVTLDRVNSPRIREVAILRLVGGYAQGSETEMRLSRAWHALSGSPAVATAIVVSSEAPDGLSDEMLLDLLRRLAAVVTPPSN